MMKSTYDPSAVESRWYTAWEDAGAFRPETNPDGAPYSIVIPPPNVTGVLHMGHALDLTIQDVLIRRKRMQGYRALWLPGTDHAGIATQNVVERELAKEGMSRHDLGREKFVEQVWTWKAKSGNRITEQMRTMGFSTDWTRERFTFDEGLSKAVRKVFVQLYDEGLIYRGNRIINWCPRCHTALSEIEVEHEDEAGELTHIKYPFVEGDGHITVATTRPETMLGDTAVAVHPDDERYRDAVGRLIRLPLLDREIPVVADEGVELEFGTGAVKVTPAHDPLDFEIGQRHGLDEIQVIDTEARITEHGGRFAGQDRFEAREAVRHELKKRGFLERIDDHHHSVGHCSRCGTVVEPMLSLQWFVKVKPLTIPAIEAVKDGRTRFVPKRWENNYFHWMENLRDWCISRQLWWGHGIPAWYCDDCDEVIVAEDDPTSCPSCASGDLTRDEDVLDTWFSSQLWPFSTMGWPEETDDLATYYPTTVLVTGFDIIYFWVARMMMMGLHFTGDVPFADVSIHGLIRTPDGRKMSKSSGNALDPLDLVERYGADPLRLSLIQAAAPGHDVPYDEAWTDAARRFGNKVWNALRFAVEHMEIRDVPASGGYPADPGPEDAWILGRLAEVTVEFDRLFDDYRFSDAYGLLYNFAWAEVFDWYLELAKTPLRDEKRAAATRATLGAVLRDLLKLLHPAIPFLTEDLWSELGDGSLLITTSWPEPPAVAGPGSMSTLQDLIIGLRRFRSEHQISPKTPIETTVSDPDGLSEPWWADHLSSLAGCNVVYGEAPDAGAMSRVIAGSVQAFIPLEGLVDIDAERTRIEKAIADSEGELARSHAKLTNPNFRDRAPAEVVAGEEAKADAAQQRLAKLGAQLEELG
ncbi:MAG: valine--tRNA ligase [Actinomycetota bacterium]